MDNNWNVRLDFSYSAMNLFDFTHPSVPFFFCSTPEGSFLFVNVLLMFSSLAVHCSWLIHIALFLASI